MDHLDEDTQLDAEYRQILSIIKPYIPSIDDHYKAASYGIWLERLSQVGSGEKLVRNGYLVELANQIHDRTVRAPFTTKPPQGPLRPLRKGLSSGSPRSTSPSDSGSWCDLSDGSQNNLAGDSLKNPSEQELEALKMRMKDLLEVKNALRDTHCLTEDRRKNIEKLQKTVVELRKKNGELQILLEGRMQKVEIMAKEIKETKEALDTEKQKNAKTAKEHEEKLAKIKYDHDVMLKEMGDLHFKMLKMKEQEITKLKAQVQKPDEEQLISLKKCISKMDKLLQKNEKEYLTKIEHLKHALELQETKSQVKLQTTRAELMIKNSEVKQEELTIALNNLEAKYKKMLRSVENHALEVKCHDEKIIEDLRELLAQNNIAF